MTLVALAGCSGDPEKRAVDFGAVDATQEAAKSLGDAGFRLTVTVVGIENGTRPIAGAFVGAATEGQALAKGYTDENGRAQLLLRKDQSLRIVAQADGWTTEDSGRIEIGAASRSNDQEYSVCTDVYVPSSSPGGYAQAPMPPMPCVVVDSDESPAYHLAGDHGAVSMVLFRSLVIQQLATSVGPHANGQVVVAPDDKDWFPKSHKLSDDPSLHRLYMLRLEHVDASLRWTNALLSQGDFELGVGCTEKKWDDATDGGPTQNYLAKQGVVHVALAWDPDRDQYWSPCKDVYGGPIVDSVNGDVDARVTLALTFEGKSRIIPVHA